MTDLHQFFVHVPRGRDSVLLCQHCDMLSTFDLLDDWSSHMRRTAATHVTFPQLDNGTSSRRRRRQAKTSPIARGTGTKSDVYDCLCDTGFCRIGVLTFLS